MKRLAPGSPDPRARRWVAVALLGLALVLGAALRLEGLDRQPPIRDETLSAFTAHHYVEHGQFGPTMPFHPNLRNLVLHASTEALGTGVAGLRGPSLLMGLLSVPLLAMLVLRLTRDRLAAALAALFLALDAVHVTFSRQSIQEVHTTFLFLAGVWLFALGFDEDWRVVRSWTFPAAGLAFGLSAASKHHGLLPLAVCLVAGVALAARRRNWPATLLCTVSLTVLPTTVYLLTYLPWFGRGYGLGEWLGAQRALLSEMVGHAGYATSSVVDDRPWQWFVKPLMGYGNFNLIDGHPFVTVALADPLVWLLVLPSSIWLFLRERSPVGVVLLQTLFWAAYLPLALSPRPIWLLSSPAVTPFAFGLVGLALVRWTDVPGRRRWLAALLAASVLFALAVHPLTAGRGWDHAYLRPLAARFVPHD